MPTLTNPAFLDQDQVSLPRHRLPLLGKWLAQTRSPGLVCVPSLHRAQRRHYCQVPLVERTTGAGRSGVAGLMR